jgi:hypothetical protein
VNAVTARYGMGHVADLAFHEGVAPLPKSRARAGGVVNAGGLVWWGQVGGELGGGGVCGGGGGSVAGYPATMAGGACATCRQRGRNTRLGRLAGAQCLVDALIVSLRCSRDKPNAYHRT